MVFNFNVKLVDICIKDNDFTNSIECIVYEK